MQKFNFKIKHDKGILNLKVNSTSKLNAIKFVLNMNNGLFTILNITKL